MRVMIVFGTRPEAIKMAPVVAALRSHPLAPQLSVCVTAQHREMLDQVLALFAISPDVDLNVMQADQTPSETAARVLTGLEPLLQETRPDWLLVQGDTTTVMAAALCAHHNHVRVGHVEAGLRSFDRANPFPEEMNRIVADHVSDRHFAPTAGARANLLREGIPAEGIFVTGNTVIDALQWTAARPSPPAVSELLARMGIDATRGEGPALLLVTAHRRENFGRPLENICAALRALAGRGDVHIVYPVHRNPNVDGPVRRLLDGVPGITLLTPVDYLTLVHLMKHSRLVLTDSGGLQEEAPSLGVPVLVLRETTERPEGVSAGTAVIAGTDTARIVALAGRLLDDAQAHAAMARAVNPYGDGRAAARIADALLTGRCEAFAGER